MPATGRPRDGESSSPSISADGRFVAFESGADNLSGEDSDGASTSSSAICRAASRRTRAAPAARRATATPRSPSISADGRFVAFGSNATNLSGEDDDAVRDVFVRDLHANTTTLVSRAGGATGAPGNDNTDEPAISADGRFVAFSSPANNLSGEDDDAFENVFVRDVLGEPTPTPPPAAGAPGAAAPDTDGPETARERPRARKPHHPRLAPRPLHALLRALRRAGDRHLPVRKVASRSFRAKAGRRVTARFRLSPSGFRTLKTNHKLRARATVLARDSLGNPTTVRFHVTLNAPKAHR